MATRRKRVKATTAAPKKRKRRVSAPGRTQERLLDAIVANPGMHGREYADVLHLTSGAVSAASMRLAKDGLVRKTGNTQSTRLFPTAKAPSPDIEVPVEPTPTEPTNGNGNGMVNVTLLKALGVEPVPATLLGDVLVVEGQVYRVNKERIGASIKG